VYDWFDVSIVNFTVGATGEAINWTDTAAPQTQYLQDDYIILTPPTCLDDYGDPYPSSSTCIKTIGPYSQAALQNYLGGFFTGSATRVFDTGGWNVSSAFIQVMLTTASTTADLLGAYTTIIQNIAIEMTNKVRQQKMDGVHEDYAEGYTYLWIMKFHIRWAYMVIPALLVILSVVFLILTIIKSVGHEKWKSSSLPLLFHGLKTAPAHILEDLTDMKDVASTTIVQLEKTADVSQFV
jgi:hypothetical protein